MRTILVLALLLAVAIVWLALRTSDVRVASHAPRATPDAAPIDSAHALAPASPNAPPSERESIESGASQTPTAPASPAAHATGVELRGTIVAIDEHGAEHTQEDGEFVLIAWTAKRGTEQTIAVRAGHWTARVPDGVLLGCGTAKLGGRDAVLEGELSGTPLQLPLPPDGSLELRVRWLRALRLFVRDRDSRVDLADVTLVRAEGWPRMEYPHPGEVTFARTLVSSKPSPLTLAPQSDRHLALHVGSPGHAWETIQLDAAEGGERSIVLGPGGDLDLELVASSVDSSSVVRVRDPLGIVAAEIDVRDRRAFAIEGLPVGRLPVSVEIGSWWKQPIVLGEGDVEIRAGARAHLVLTLNAPPASASVAIGGEVRIGAEWGLEKFMLAVELLDPPLGGREARYNIASKTMRADSERTGVWHWRLDGMQPGRYLILLWQLQYAIALEVGNEGRDDILLEAPPPCDVRVRVVDKLAGTEAQVESVAWNCKRPDWARGGGAQPAEWNAEDRAWHLRAPRGEIELHARGARYRPVQRMVELRLGTNEFVLEVERQYSFSLTLAQSGIPVPWPRFVYVKLRAEDEERSWGGGGVSALVVTFDHPGPWTVTLPDLPGFEPVPPFEVRVDPERVLERTIELVPKR